DYVDNISLRSLFKISNQFSSNINVRTKEINNALCSIEENRYMASMCMLGNSIFTNAPLETVRKILGDVSAITCTASTEEAKIIRTA
ncbi:MAG TPA: hypothetical protein VJY42_04125, partial [Candidatus Methanomethylophilaceae archaeon]|nr:hypothetical protein [Candidatus Methanomethylophilaceae archaeon]